MRTLVTLISLALVAAAHAAPLAAASPAAPASPAASAAPKPPRASAARKAGELAREAAKLAAQAAELARQAEETAKEGEKAEEAATRPEPTKAAPATSESVAPGPVTPKSVTGKPAKRAAKPAAAKSAAKPKARATKPRQHHPVELPGLASHAEPESESLPLEACSPARACPTSYAPTIDRRTGKAPLDIARFREKLARAYRTPERRRAVLGVRELDCYPVLIFHERFRFETLWFGARLYDRADYRFQKPKEVALTIDEGGHAPMDMDKLYEEPEPSLCVVDSPSGPIVVAASCPEFPPPYRNRPRTPREPSRFPPDVLIGRLDPDGRLIPAANLPSIQAGWRYAYDPFCGVMTRIHAGRFFGPPGANSPVARTFTNHELVIRDAAGHPMCGARIAVATMPNEPEGILVVEHDGLRIPIGTSGPRERALTEELTCQPGKPVRVDRVQFVVQAFRAEGVDLEPDGIRLLPHALP